MTSTPCQGAQPFPVDFGEFSVAKAADDGEFVQSLARGLRVLQSFSAENPSMTVTEVAEQTDLSRGTARRLLLTLDRLGFVGSDGKQFWLKPQVMDLGYRYLSSLPWWQLAKPIIEEATSAVNEACNVGILDGVDIIYTAGVEVNRIVSTNIRIGSRLPAHATATGRVLLSLLPDRQLDSFFKNAKLKQLTPKTVVDEATLRSILRKVRADQYCLVDQELELGLRSIAVAVTDRTGKTLGAMSLSSNAQRLEIPEIISRHLPALREACEKIARAVPT
jgi:IclR family transcriptional regulator, pca regulon regulatory protein